VTLLRFTIVAMIAAAILQACIIVPIPPVWDADNPVRRFREIKIGVTTKEEVIDIMGEPQTTVPLQPRKYGSGSQQTSLEEPVVTKFIYRGEVDEMSFCYAWSNLYDSVGGNCVTDDDEWFVHIYLNESGIVTSVETSEGDANRGGRTRENPSH
jgi:hypothetical protein